MILDPNEMGSRDRYRLTIGLVVPRPIAWVSSMAKDGTLNLAPFSFFTVASTKPLTLIFCAGTPSSGTPKDTLRNVQETKEFVVNIVDEAAAEAMNKTATEYPPDMSEFEHAGLTPAPSESIAVPRVAEAPASFECTLHDVVPVGAASVVFGSVQRIVVRDDVYRDGLAELRALQPVGRLGGAGYVRVTDTFEMPRIPFRRA